MNASLTSAPAAATLCLWSFACHAGRPLATEDADILEPRDCEWEYFVARESASASPSVKGWTTQVGCGIGLSTQVALAYARARAQGLTAQGLVLVGKTGLKERKGDSLGLTLAWTLGAEKVPGSSHELTQLNLVATKELAENLTGHANLGWARSEFACASSTTWNVATEYSLGAGVDLMAEYYDDDRSKPWLGAGRALAGCGAVFPECVLQRAARNAAHKTMDCRFQAGVLTEGSAVVEAKPLKPTLIDYRRYLLVCTGERCVEDGMTAEQLCVVGQKLGKAGLLHDGPLRVKPSRVNCLGACRSGPVMCVQPDGAWYLGVTPANLDRIIEQHLVGGALVEDLAFHQGPGTGARAAAAADPASARAV